MENEYENFIDDDGNPKGGYFEGCGISIKWQEGSVVDGEPNGAFVDNVLLAAKIKLDHYQSTKFKCRETQIAITKVEEAIMWLQKRIQDRKDRSVLNKHES